MRWVRVFTCDQQLEARRVTGKNDTSCTGIYVCRAKLQRQALPAYKQSTFLTFYNSVTYISPGAAGAASLQRQLIGSEGRSEVLSAQ